MSIFAELCAALHAAQSAERNVRLAAENYLNTIAVRTDSTSLFLSVAFSPDTVDSNVQLLASVLLCQDLKRKWKFLTDELKSHIIDKSHEFTRLSISLQRSAYRNILAASASSSNNTELTYIINKFIGSLSSNILGIDFDTLYSLLVVTESLDSFSQLHILKSCSLLLQNIIQKADSSMHAELILCSLKIVRICFEGIAEDCLSGGLTDEDYADVTTPGGLMTNWFSLAGQYVTRFVDIRHLLENLAPLQEFLNIQGALLQAFPETCQNMADHLGNLIWRILGAVHSSGLKGSLLYSKSAELSISSHAALNGDQVSLESVLCCMIDVLVTIKSLQQNSSSPSGMAY